MSAATSSCIPSIWGSHGINSRGMLLDSEPLESITDGERAIRSAKNCPVKYGISPCLLKVVRNDQMLTMTPFWAHVRAPFHGRSESMVIISRAGNKLRSAEVP